MLSVDRTLSAAEVKRRIAKYADPITDGETDSLLPLGRINACRALLLLDCELAAPASGPAGPSPLGLKCNGMLEQWLFATHLIHR